MFWLGDVNIQTVSHDILVKMCPRPERGRCCFSHGYATSCYSAERTCRLTQKQPYSTIDDCRNIASAVFTVPAVGFVFVSAGSQLGRTNRFIACRTLKGIQRACTVRKKTFTSFIFFFVTLHTVAAVRWLKGARLRVFTSFFLFDRYSLVTFGRNSRQAF